MEAAGEKAANMIANVTSAEEAMVESTVTHCTWSWSVNYLLKLII